jgi:hypothetical protein
MSKNNTTSYFVGAYLDISSMIPRTPQTEFKIKAFLNQENNLSYLLLDSIEEYNKYYTINSESSITDVLLYSNPTINSPLNYLSSPNLSRVSLSITDSLNPGEEGILDLFPGIMQLISATIDPTGRYAYFATMGMLNMQLTSRYSNLPSRIVKFDLVTQSVIKRIRLNAENREQLGRIALMDPFGVYAYFVGRNTYNDEQQTSKLFKIDLATFTIFSVTTLPLFAKIEEGCGVIDPSGEYAYFGSGANTPTQRRIFKVNLITGVINTITMSTGEYNFKCAVIDEKANYAYFGMYTQNPKIVKIDLTTFTRVTSINITKPPGVTTVGLYLHTAIIDPAYQYAYFGTDSFPGSVIKIDLNTFTQVGSIVFNADPYADPETGESWVGASTIDPYGKYAYFATFSSPGNIIKVDLATFSIVDRKQLNERFTCCVMDPVGYYAYFGNHTDIDSYFTTIRLSSFTVEANTLLPKGFESFVSSCIDSKNVFAFFGTGGTINNPRIIRVDLKTFSLVNYGEFTYSLSETNPANPSVECMILDPINGRYMYAGFNLGYFENYSCLEKIDLVNFNRVNTITLAFAIPMCILVDKNGTYAYVGAISHSAGNPTGGKILKIDLATFTQVAVLVLNADERPVRGVMEPNEEYAYFCTESTPGKIVRVNLTTFTRVDALTLNSNENSPTCILLNPKTLVAYLGLNTYPGRIVKVNLDTMQRLDAIVLDASRQETYIKSGVINSNLRYAFFSSSLFSRSKIIKIDLVRFIVDSSVSYQTLGSYTAVTTLGNQYMYFGSEDGYIIRIPTASEFILSGLSGNTPGNLANTVTFAEIDFKSQAVQQQRNQQSIVPYYFLLRVDGQTGSEVSDDSFVIHTRFKVYPK